MGTDFPEFRGSQVLRGGHLQTIVGNFIPAGPEPGQTVRHQIDTTLGDQLVLHETFPPSLVRPVHDVLMLHGVGGSYASPYMVRAARLLVESGCRVWRLDMRGCGAGIALARHHTHAGRIEDLQAVVDWFCARDAKEKGDRREESPPLSIVGFSLGANLALKWLAARKDGRHPRVSQLMAIAPPVDLVATSKALKKGAGRFYDLFFARTLRRRLIERRRLRPDMTDTGVNPVPRTLEKFDAEFTAPLGGYSSVQDYYLRSSSANDLWRIETPTTILCDTDDPVIPIRHVTGFPLGPGVRVLQTSGGGHLGYLSFRGAKRGFRWIDFVIRDWVFGREPAFVTNSLCAP